MARSSREVRRGNMQKVSKHVRRWKTVMHILSTSLSRCEQRPLLLAHHNPTQSFLLSHSVTLRASLSQLTSAQRQV
ncbi:unnamed protein product [Chondrus crispus]|uniref:Uncharacterized protein n=1 Tax=Chondrus crispus TaxID=2769 RepID=R7QPK0_CHOCR|nr:unnamed protein product [Chondrus crispus]CDF39325.1 unnamed protein product [Chondrus crispus]|eukprot:XP_005719236.1 unnamed protein product [Chondrus crispus]